MSWIDTERGLVAVLNGINQRRIRQAGSDDAEDRSVDRVVEQLFHATEKLAIYGSLAPGAPNYAVISDLGGSWLDGYVRGTLHTEGWGAEIGYPAMRWDPAGERIPVRLLVSPGLPSVWGELDSFEGVEYCRILVPVFNDAEPVAVANIYAARV